MGRPIDHLGSRISYPDLSDDVRRVLTKLGTVERDVQSRDGNHYIARVHPYRSVDNFIAGAVLTFLDVTRTVKAEAALRESEGRLRLLLAELQHRVRNTLALVKSITTRTAESSRSVEDMASHLAGRLDAFARVQSAVTRNPDGVVDLRALIADELLAHAAHEGDQIVIEGPDISLRPKAAESMSLAIHELTTNAVKHGALGTPGATINIRWSLNGGRGKRMLSFRWEERGLSGVKKPKHQGFGMELLTRMLPYDLAAKTAIAFDPEGFEFTMELPAKHVADVPVVADEGSAQS
jgi:two-component system CheB/CheR fusion protein